MADRSTPGWGWVVAPMLLAAALVGGVAIAVRSGDDGSPTLAGPPGELPAVVTAAEELLGTVPEPDAIAARLGARYGQTAAALSADVDDPVAFAAEFDRLPDAQARAVGRTLGGIQAELAPTSEDGARDDDDRPGDIVFALQLARATIQSLDPDGTPRDQALAVLPFSVQDLTGFDEVASTFAGGDLVALGARIDPALSDAGASELVSSVANAIAAAVPGDYAAELLEGYGAASG